MEGYQDPLSSVAKGLQNGMQIKSERARAAMAAGQAKFEAIKGERNKYLDLASNPDFDPDVRKSFYLMAVKANNTISPQNPLPAIDNFDQPVAAVLNARNTMLKMKEKGLVNDDQIDTYMRQLIAEQARKSKVPEIEYMQSLQYGAGAIQTVGTGLEQTQARVNPEGVMIPVKQPESSGTGTKPVKVPNKELTGQLEGLRSKVLGDENVKESRFQIAKIKTVNEMAKENPDGAAGVLSQITARLFEKQRLSDEDVKNLNVSQSVKAQVLDFFNKAKSGQKSKLSTENIRLITRIVSEAAEKSQDEIIGSYADSEELLLQGSGVDRKQLTKFLKAGASEYKQYQKPEEVKAALSSGEITKDEAIYLLKKNFKFGD